MIVAYPLPNSHFLKNGLTRRMLEAMMLKAMTTRAIRMLTVAVLNLSFFKKITSHQYMRGDGVYTPVFYCAFPVSCKAHFGAFSFGKQYQKIASRLWKSRYAMMASRPRPESSRSSEKVFSMICSRLSRP